MKLTAGIRQIEMAIMVAKANRADISELNNALNILKVAESSGTGLSHSADVGERASAKPTPEIQWRTTK